MKTVHVSASRDYDVRIGSGLFAGLGALIKQSVPAQTAVLVTDDTVDTLYGTQAARSLAEAGFRVLRFVFPHGERSKSLATFGQVLNFLCENHVTRSDVIIALGGGVVGDLAGFTAACYQRGIRFVQVPTTLLAMVDSSVGGKTAVDLDTGKNMAGAFWQPSLVLCDPDLLSTLPDEQYRCGCAEILKYGLMADAEFFDGLSKTPVRAQYESVIARCVEMKRDVVDADEFDRGARQKLNLGHTVGHAVEECSGFTLLHGQCVAIGMGVITRAAAANGYCSAKTAQRVDAILAQYGLPAATDYALDDLFRAGLSDKKVSGSMLNLIVPDRIGHCQIVTIPSSELRGWLAAGGVR